METIVIIDSGLDNSYHNVIGGVTLTIGEDGALHIADTYTDEFGHGTAIYHLINDACNNINFFIVKIFNSHYQANQVVLLHALQYIYANVSCKFIIISSGSIVCHNKNEVSSIIDKLYNEKHTFIVSAFSNEGGLSFPSSHPTVIGVDSSELVSPMERYYIVRNSPVDILSSKRTQRLKWLNGAKNIASGNSFLAPEFAAMMITAYQQSEAPIVDKNRLLDAICHGTNSINIEATAEYSKTKERLAAEYLLGKTERRMKAIAFPFSKEIKALAANEDLLHVDIVDYCDIKQGGKTSLEVGQLLGFCDNKKTIKNIESIDWQYDFDLIVLGHCGLINATREI